MQESKKAERVLVQKVKAEPHIPGMLYSLNNSKYFVRSPGIVCWRPWAGGPPSSVARRRPLAGRADARDDTIVST